MTIESVFGENILSNTPIVICPFSNNSTFITFNNERLGENVSFFMIF